MDRKPVEDQVERVRALLADQLRTQALHPTIGGTVAPLNDAADYVMGLPLDRDPLVALAASKTDLDLDLLLIGRYDPRTTAVEQLILGVIEANLDDLDDLDNDLEADEP